MKICASVFSKNDHFIDMYDILRAIGFGAMSL